jgi:hypothetical protein
MDPTSYHYNDDVKYTELEEDHFVTHFALLECTIILAVTFVKLD